MAFKLMAEDICCSLNKSAGGPIATNEFGGGDYEVAAAFSQIEKMRWAKLSLDGRASASGHGNR